jgi:hypothetical protein
MALNTSQTLTAANARFNDKPGIDAPAWSQELAPTQRGGRCRTKQGGTTKGLPRPPEEHANSSVNGIYADIIKSKCVYSKV